MHTQSNCQACRRPADDRLLDYRRGATVLHHESFLQCDICERYACAECLQVYDFFSGYDFLCNECARGFGNAVSRSTRGH